MRTMLGQADRVLIFDAVAEEGSFTRAAARLGCSKAHVSTQLGLLESYLGVQLVHRTTRQITLTEAGHVYRGYAKQVHETLLAAANVVSASRSEVAGRIQITVPTSLGETALPEMILAFRQQHPNVEPVVDMSSVHRDLISDGFDVAIRLTNSLESNFVARSLGVVREAVVATPSLIEAHPPVIAPPDLAQLPCLVNYHFRDEPRWMFSRKGEHIKVMVSGPVKANTQQGIHRFALLGAGVGRLPRYMVEADIVAGRLAVLCEDWETVALPLYIVYPGQRHLPMRTRVFVDFAIRWFAEPSRRAMFS